MLTRLTLVCLINTNVFECSLIQIIKVGPPLKFYEFITQYISQYLMVKELVQYSWTLSNFSILEMNMSRKQFIIIISPQDF